MRTLTETQRQTLLGNSYRVSARVWVEDSTGAWRNLSTLNGVDWVDEISWDEDIDQPVSQVTVRLWREIGALSLAPLRAGSLLNQEAGQFKPLLEAGREVKVEVATTPVGVDPATADWKVAFQGEIDEVDWGGNASRITLTARDLGGRLLDHFIEEERTYGSAAGMDVEAVMQKILDDNPVGTPAVRLFSPGGTDAAPFATAESPGWKIKEFKQEKESLLEGLRKLAQQIGWDVRYRWNEPTGKFQLTLFDPERADTTVRWTFTPSQYLDVSSLRTTRAGVRNVVKVTYTDSADGKRKTVMETDTASVSRFGRRFMELEEESSSMIDTADEARRMAQAALSDLSDPKAEQEIELHFFWPAELGDLYRFKANGVHYDADQDWASVVVRHQISREQQRTTIRVRGRVAGAYRDWLRREIRVSGEAVTPPSVAILVPQAVLTAARNASDVYVYVTTDDGEFTRLLLLENDDLVTWSLVRSGTDATPRYVAPGTQVGPDAWFWNGSSFAQKMSAIPLRRDQVRRVTLVGEAQNSGLRSPATSITLNVREQPWLESVDLIWDETTDTLTMRAVGGAFCQSARVEVANNDTFSGARTAVVALADGQAASALFSLADGDRGRQWHGRVTPYNGPRVDTNADGSLDSTSGIAGEAQRDSEFIPASESGAGIQPPTAEVVWVSSTRTTETVRYTGALGAGGRAPLRWQSRVDTDVATGSYGPLSTTFDTTQEIARDPFWTKYVVMRVVDADDRETVVEYPISPSLEGVSTDGKVHGVYDATRNTLVTGREASFGYRIWDPGDPLKMDATETVYPGGVRVADLQPRQAGADITGSNTAADTANVDGRAAAKVRSDAVVGRSTAAVAADNLLRNGGGQEDEDGATASGWTMAGGVLRTTMAQARIGDRSLVFDHATGADAVAYQDIPVANDEVVEVSAWIRTSALPAADAGQGAILNPDRGTGVTQLVSLERETEFFPQGYDPDGVDVGIPANGVARDWTFVRTMFRVVGTGFIRIHLQLGYGGAQRGTAWFDGITVRKRTRYEVEGALLSKNALDGTGLKATATLAGVAASAVLSDAQTGRKGVGTVVDNVLANGGAQDGLTGWTTEAGYQAPTVDATVAKFGDRSFTFNITAGVEGQLAQSYKVANGDVVEVSGWVKTTALPAVSPGQGVVFHSSVVSGVTKVTSLERDTVVYPAIYDPDAVGVGLPGDGVARDWTFVRSLFKVEGAAEGVMRLSIYMGYGGYQAGQAWVDGVTVRRRTRLEAEGALLSKNALNATGLKDDATVAGRRAATVRAEALLGRQAVAVSPDNLVRNGGGQEGEMNAVAPAWMYAYGAQIETTDVSEVGQTARVGDRSLAFRHASAVDSVVFQDFTVVAGEVYELSGWVMVANVQQAGQNGYAMLNLDHHATPAGGHDSVEVLESQAPFRYGPDIGVKVPTTVGETTGWKLVRAVIRMKAGGTVRLHLQLGYVGAVQANAYFDGVSLTRTNDSFSRVYDNLDTDGVKATAKVAGVTASELKADAETGRTGAGTWSENRLLNSGAQSDILGWDRASWSTGVSTMRADTSRYRLGDRSFRIDSNGADSAWYQDVPVKTGQVVDVTGWMQCTALRTDLPGQGAFLNIDPGPGVQLYAMYRDAPGYPARTQDPLSIDIGIPADGRAYTDRWYPVRSVFEVGGASGFIRLYMHVGYNGAQTATAWFDGLGVRVMEPSIQRTYDVIDSEGRLKPTVTKFDGKRSVTLAQFALSGSARDNEAVTFAEPFQSAPVVLCGAGGVTYDPSFGNVMQYLSVYADEVSPAGFRMRARIQPLAQNTAPRELTPSSGIASNNVGSAYNNQYTFHYSLTIASSSHWVYDAPGGSTPGDFEVVGGGGGYQQTTGGHIELGFHTRHPGGQWALRSTRVYENYTGISVPYSNQTETLTLDGLGEGSEFRVTAELTADNGASWTFESVSFQVGTTTPAHSATPDGVAPIPFIALGGRS